jgi:hypothetical protein
MTKDELVAPVYVPDEVTGFWGGPDERPRCSLDGKVIKDEAGAKRTAERAGMQAYLGKCGHWHVGHAKRRMR